MSYFSFTHKNTLQPSRVTLASVVLSESSIHEKGGGYVLRAVLSVGGSLDAKIGAAHYLTTTNR